MTQLQPTKKFNKPISGTCINSTPEKKLDITTITSTQRNRPIKHLQFYPIHLCSRHLCSRGGGHRTEIVTRGGGRTDWCQSLAGQAKRGACAAGRRRGGPEEQLELATGRSESVVEDLDLATSEGVRHRGAYDIRGSTGSGYAHRQKGKAHRGHT